MFTKRILIVVVSLLITVALIFCFRKFSRNVLADMSRGNRLAVAMMSGWAPFMMINNQGEYEGFDVDVAREIAKRMHKELEIVDAGSLAPTFIALEQGKVDLVLSGLDITKERLKHYTMVPYTGESNKYYCLLFWQQIPAGIKTIEDLACTGGAICVEPGSAQERFLDTITGISQKQFGKVEEMILDVQYGKSMALLVEAQVARRIQKVNPDFKSLLVLLPKEFQVFGMGIAIALQNEDLSTAVASIISALRVEGILDLLERKWQLREE